MGPWGSLNLAPSPPLCTAVITTITEYVPENALTRTRRSVAILTDLDNKKCYFPSYSTVNLENSFIDSCLRPR